MKPRRAKQRRGAARTAPEKRRDQAESAFTTILGGLVARVPGVRAVAMVDSEGETVDYAGRGDPFGLRVSAAHWRIVLQQASALKSLQGLQWLTVRGERRSHVVYALPHGYALVVAFHRAPGLARWQRAVAACARALGQEAGWTADETRGLAALPTGATGPNRLEAQGRRWFPVEIVTDESRRPRAVRIGGRLYALEILGAIVRHEQRADAGNVPRGGPSSSPGERAWRVRFEKGVEATIARGRGETWYADEPVDLLVEPE